MNAPGKFPLPILVGLAACTWLAVAVFLYGAKPELGFFKPMSIVTAVLAAVLASFDRWLWRIPPFSWIHGVPDLNGTWIGETRSTYQDPQTKTTVEPIKSVAVIRQTYTSIYVRQFSVESISVSLAGKLVADSDGQMKVWYLFRNEPKLSVQDRSRVNYGGAHLAIGDEDEVLDGAYWTDRKTSGEISLRYVSSKHAKDYNSGMAIAAKEKPKGPPTSAIPNA